MDKKRKRITMYYMSEKKTPAPSSVRLDASDKKALAFIMRLLSKHGTKITKSAAIKTSIQIAKEKLERENE
jgi:hypothetical protein